MDRRRFLSVAAAVGATGCTLAPPSTRPGSGGDGTDPTTDAGTTEPGPGLPDAVGLDVVTTGLQGPLDVAFAPDADRRYIAEQRGLLRVHESEGLRDTPLLDLRDAVVAGGEMGLLGVALHPEFADNGRLFVRYSAPRRAGTPSDYSHTFVLSEFSVREDGLVARRDSERTVLEIPEPQRNHNAGSVAFGPDGYLYVGVGDGGNAGDQGTGHVDDWYDRVGGGNGQDVTENLLGSVLRIDVDDGDDGGGGGDGGDNGGAAGGGGDTRGYGVPEDNPLVGRAGLDEHYAWGFRNPWRFAFDGADLYVADVGQSRYEEVDLVEKGGNYGWNVREGRHCYDADSCPDRTPDGVRGGEPLREPIIDYPHSGAAVSGISVIGGNVYRGDAMPGLVGAYVFGDYRAQGELFVARPRDSGPWRPRVLPVADGDADLLRSLRSFGRHDGELYALGDGAEGGGLFRLAPGSD